MNKLLLIVTLLAASNIAWAQTEEGGGEKPPQNPLVYQASQPDISRDRSPAIDTSTRRRYAQQMQAAFHRFAVMFGVSSNPSTATPSRQKK